MRRPIRARGATVLVVTALALAALLGPAEGAPVGPCPVTTPIDGTITVATVDEPETEADRNHLAGRIGPMVLDYLSPPGEPLDQSMTAMATQAGLDPRVEVTATMVERSVLVSLRTTAAVVACVDEGGGVFVEVTLSDPRLSFTGDPVDDPGSVRVTAGHVAVTVTRHRTTRPVVEFAVSGALPPGPAVDDGGPRVDPIAARPTFVG